jgi:hypothetical protein
MAHKLPICFSWYILTWTPSNEDGGDGDGDDEDMDVVNFVFS